ncbi:MAG: hypothetical protein KGL16_00710 [Acidobacteriota bacterium]|nr:hypothetical protein [Acidobacteriota bacterium]
MHGEAARQGNARRRRRPAAALAVAVAIALATAGCAGSTSTANTPAVPIVTGEQVVSICFQNYFYNGILPRAAAKTNCKACVVDRLAKRGVHPTGGETVLDMLTGYRLSKAVSQSLQNACTEPDANAQ